MKSIVPLPSLSKIRNIWSTKTFALPTGRIIEYMSSILSLPNSPSGQSTWKKKKMYWSRNKFESSAQCGPAKCTLISKSFLGWLQFLKKHARYYPEYLHFRRIVLRVVIWHLFWEIWTKIKIFLRLSRSKVVGWLIYSCCRM